MVNSKQGVSFCEMQQIKQNIRTMKKYHKYAERHCHHIMVQESDEERYTGSLLPIESTLAKFYAEL